jgi:hypothetical protein
MTNGELSGQTLLWRVSAAVQPEAAQTYSRNGAEL